MPAAEIAFIAPNENLADQAESIIRRHGYQAKVWFGHLQAGVKAAHQALAEGAKVIVSRGGTASLIQDALGREMAIEVVEVQASVYNLIGYLHRHARPGYRVALVGSRLFTSMGGSVCQNLEITHCLHETTEPAAAEEAIRRIRAWRADVVIGDAVSRRFMQGRDGIGYQVVESSLESVKDAFDRAALVIANLRRQLAFNRKLATVLECAQEGVAMLDKAGAVEDINRRGMLLLGLAAADKPSGRQLVDILPSDELAAAIRERAEARCLVANPGGEQLHVSLSPLDPALSGEEGMVLTLQPVRHIQEMESNIRKRLHNRGFYAKHTFADIVHSSPAMRRAIALAREYAKSEANIVITGETGTGKELFAQGIHNAGPLSAGMFVAVNCATLPPSLLESELFGYAPGAFTGASRSGKVGLFELAHNGTIFLDEITEMDPLLQSRLLRVLQERELVRIGDDKVIPVKVRVIAAANRDMEEELANGNMRPDLYFRLNVLTIRLPPLREREGDAVRLFRHFLAARRPPGAEAPAEPDPAFLARIAACRWPGNVRELENAAEKYRIIQSLPAPDEFADVLGGIGEGSGRDGGRAGPEKLDDIVRAAVAKTLEREGGNIVRASRRLGISRNTLKRWLRAGE